MRKELILNYLLVGIGIYLLNMMYRMPDRIPRFIMVVLFAVVLGTVLERIYFFFLIKRKVGVIVRLMITLPIGIGMLYFFRYFTDQMNGHHLDVMILTGIGVIIIDQINYRLYKKAHKQVNDQLILAKKNASHME